MRSFKKAFKVKDKWATPTSLVTLLLPKLKEWERVFIAEHNRKPIIWCPFDTEKSKYVEILKKEGFEVKHTTIEYDEDFFNIIGNIDYDIAVSNPPFSLKKDIFTELWKEGKPFVMLMNLMAINYQEIGNLFYRMGTEIQFLIPDKKVSFDGNTASFCSGYVCYKFLERTEFVHLENNNTGENYRK